LPTRLIANPTTVRSFVRYVHPESMPHSCSSIQIRKITRPSATGAGSAQKLSTLYDAAIGPLAHYVNVDVDGRRRRILDDEKGETTMARKPYRQVLSILGIFSLALVMLASHAPSARGADARMSRTESQLVAAQFLDGMLTNGPFAQVCSPNLLISIVDSGQSVVGVSLARLAFDEIMQNSHATDATVESLIVGEGNASAEIALTGNVLDSNGTIAEPGRVVRTTYSVFLDMNTGKVTSLHIYGFDDLLTLNVPATPDSYYPVQTFPGKPY
jgi:hypothetical protein